MSHRERLTSSIQHYVPVSRLLSGIPLGRMVWKPAVAAALMATYLGLAATERTILAGVSVALLYGVVLLVLGILACGSIREFKTRFFCTWSGASVRQEEIHS